MKPQPELALAIIRIAVGVAFCWHGWQTLFTTGLQTVTRQFEATGVPLPLLTAPTTAVLELLGGLLLGLGLGARGLAGALALSTLLVGGTSALAGALPALRLELSALLLAGSLAVMVGGTGRPSVEGWRAASPSATRGSSAVRRRKG
ncbi:DoxX family protein [Deinococcus koreensis]|uniref:DoxX family protein n=1 Tax=Deinococcus koreensis TaxID=2054903 RepID=A0A2K3V1F7_9DEIO|nr:DoxX family protein [Deinococcus koreensis]PNY82617.1 DoxX family protein [Deinococcus koreensis]